MNATPIGYLIVPAGGTLRCPRCTLWVCSLGSDVMARVRWYEARIMVVPSPRGVALRCERRRCLTTMEVEFSHAAA